MKELRQAHQVYQAAAGHFRDGMCFVIAGLCVLLQHHFSDNDFNLINDDAIDEPNAE